MKDDFAVACEQLAKSIADEVGVETKLPCGYHAKVDEKTRRVLFTFRVGLTEATMKYSTPVYDIVKLKSSTISWQPIFEELVKQVLKDTSPLGYAQRLARKASGEPTPEIPVFVDQQGRRHHTLKAETGYLDGLLSNIKMIPGKGANPT